MFHEKINQYESSLSSLLNENASLKMQKGILKEFLVSSKNELEIMKSAFEQISGERDDEIVE